MEPELDSAVGGRCTRGCQWRSFAGPGTLESMDADALRFRFTFDFEDRRLELPEGRYTLGRGSRCAIRVNKSLVSREHLVIHIEGAEASIEDLGSKNGTKINGMAVHRRMPLSHGDVVTAGTIEFCVRISPEAGFLDEDTLTLRGKDRVSILGREDSMRCPNCGKSIARGEESSHCHHCGRRLRRKAESYTAELPVIDIED